MGFFEKLKNGMAKTRKNIAEKLNAVFAAFVRVDDDLLDELEETLILCDFGVGTTEKIMERLRQEIKLLSIEPLYLDAKLKICSIIYV